MAQASSNPSRGGVDAAQADEHTAADGVEDFRTFEYLARAIKLQLEAPARALGEQAAGDDQAVGEGCRGIGQCDCRRPAHSAPREQYWGRNRRQPRASPAERNAGSLDVVHFFPSQPLIAQPPSNAICRAAGARLERRARSLLS